jgi:hypothetical protein
MSALLGDGLPALTLSEQDLQVDRKLPEAKQKSNVSPPKDAKEPTLKEGAISRTSKQGILKTRMTDLQDEEYNRKMYIKKTWVAANNVTKQSYMNMISNYNLPEYKDLINYIKQERAWWKSTHSSGLTVSTLETVFSDFNDEIGDRLKRYEDALKENNLKGEELIEERKKEKVTEEDAKEGEEGEEGVLGKKIDWSKITSEKGDEDVAATKEAKEAKVDDPFKRTVWDDVNESWVIIGSFLGSLLWFIFGLRFGSSITNEYYYLKSSYKILIFVYTVIFTPALVPYFIYKTIRTWLYPITYPPFTYRCFLPLYESRDPKLSNSWFTYIVDDATIADKFSKLKKIEDSKRNILKESILEGLQIELAKYALIAAKDKEADAAAKKKQAEQDAADAEDE